MIARKLSVFFVVAVFSLGLAGTGFSAEMAGDAAKSTVTKIENGKVTLKDNMGEKTIQPINEQILTELKIGDTVSVKDGKIVRAIGSSSTGN